MDVGHADLVLKDWMLDTEDEQAPEESRALCMEFIEARGPQDLRSCGPLDHKS